MLEWKNHRAEEFFNETTLATPAKKSVFRSVAQRSIFYIAEVTYNVYRRNITFALYFLYKFLPNRLHYQGDFYIVKKKIK